MTQIYRTLGVSLAIFMVVFALFLPPAYAASQSADLTEDTVINPAASGPHRLSQIYAFVSNCSSPYGGITRWSEPSVIARGGNSYLIGTHFKHLADMGIKNIYFNCPFGNNTTPDGQASFTYFGARDAGENSVWVKNFVSEMKKFKARYPDVKILAYVGNPMWDKRFTDAAGLPNVISSQAPNRAEAFRMLDYEMRILWNAGIRDLAIDASFNIPEAHLLGGYLKNLSKIGFRIYIEARPLLTHQWLSRYGLVETTWFNRGAPYWSGMVDQKNMKGGRIVLYSGTAGVAEGDGKPFEQWASLWVKRSLDKGLSPAMGMEAMFVGSDPAINRANVLRILGLRQ